MNEYQRMSLESAGDWITVPTGNTTKYRRGVLGVITGSTAYPGAAVIGVRAALHTGVGMLRYIGPQRAADLVLRAQPEAVVGAGRVQAWLIGSGTNAHALDEETAEGFRRASEEDVPLIVDAGALGAIDAGSRAVLTPHAGELATLLGEPRTAIEDDPARWALRAADRTGAVVLLKGARTHVAAPDASACLIAESATPWLATAGAGDALGGVIGALVATRAGLAEAEQRSLTPSELAHLACAGAVIHGTAAVRASHGGPFTMDALAAAVSAVVAELAGRVR